MDNEPVVVYGAAWCGDCRRAESWLRDNLVPYVGIDVEHDAAAREAAVELAGGRRNIPVVVMPGGEVLVEPTNTQLAVALGQSVS